MLIKRYVIIWRKGGYDNMTCFSITSNTSHPYLSYSSLRIKDASLVKKKVSRSVFDFIIDTKLVKRDSIRFGDVIGIEETFKKFFKVYINYNNNKKILGSYYVK